MSSRLAVRAAGRILGAGATAIALILAMAGPAAGLPAFARKYGTSCLTCHTIYPVLNPFGEAFRHNGYRFPGIDSDYWKQDPVPLGQDAQKKAFPHAAWPGSLAPSVPIAVGFNGQAILHPDRKAGGAVADNRARFSLANLVEEGHVWAGGSFDDKITFFGELTVGEDGAELELAQVRFNDLFGAKHAANLVVGKALPNVTSFGPHSTYLSDLAVTPLMTTALFGATTDSWNVPQAYDSVELNGTLNGRLDYALGANAGANVGVQDTENWYAHAGYKIGGLRVDGEGSSGPADPMKPWAERSLTVYGFYYQAVSRFTAGDSLMTNLTDRSPAVGGGLRLLMGSLSLDSGVYREKHDHAAVGFGEIKGLVQYDELAYVVYPWLVPAVRVEYLRLEPEGGPAVTDFRAFGGIAAIVRPNLKINLIAQIERAKGAPPAGWSPAGGLAMPSGPQEKVGPEVEAIAIGLAYAF